MIALLLGLACGEPKGTDPQDSAPPEADADTDADTDSDSDADADADSDADADTDTDTDVTPDTETDCTDGADNDLDGLLDCEDEDCIDVCFEDCDNDLDDDSDGLTDCEDDECAGEPWCSYRDFTVQVDYQIEGLYFYQSSYLARLLGTPYDAVGGVYGYVDVTATSPDPDTSDTADASLEFTCTGAIEVFSDAWAAYSGYANAYGLTHDTGDCEGCDWRFEFQPDRPRWSGGCPLAAMPVTHWGVFIGERYVKSDLGGSTWVDQYVSASRYSYWYVDRDYTYGGLYYPTTTYPVLTTGSYRPSDL